MILPRENLRDLEDVPEDVRSELAFVPADTVEDVVKEALGITLTRPLGLHTGNGVVPAQNI